MATTFCVPIDNAATTVATAYVAGSATVVVSDGTLFGSPTAGAPVRFSMIASSGLDAYGRVSDRTKVATYRATGRSSNTLTGVTLESGTDQNFGVGSFVGVLVTAATLSSIHTAVNAVETGKADLASPTFTGTPAAPTASAGTNTTQVATTAFVSTAVGALPASAITSGQVATARGGTGVDGSAAANGQLLIGNGSGYSLGSLTAGSNVTITPGAGSITIAAAGGSPGGSSGTIQYNASGSFAGLAGSTIATSGTHVAVVAQADATHVYEAKGYSGSQSGRLFRGLTSAGSECFYVGGAGNVRISTTGTVPFVAVSDQITSGRYVGTGGFCGFRACVTGQGLPYFTLNTGAAADGSSDGAQRAYFLYSGSDLSTPQYMQIGYSTGTSRFHVLTSGTYAGCTGLGNETSPVVDVHVTGSSTTRPVARINGPASHNAALAEFAVNNTVLSSIDKNGGFVLAQMSDATAANGTIYWSTTGSKAAVKDLGGSVHYLW